VKNKMIEINLKKVIDKAKTEIFYQHLAELIYEEILIPLGW
jgi:hypothetical protein